ncbi:hypothetical protein E2C01_009233 [Portunus trituberculatus]|uniref:Activin types I and II receptor domain-containing protein n=1 Tax=Portunus trituberculatus TaxID=210409 RepID=A0A5B7D2X4_PORTR|nr:hypothetical protein [Portunus trituberculatus]
MKRLGNSLLLCCLVILVDAFQDEEVKTPGFTADNFTTIQSTISDKIAEKNLDSTETSRKLKCLCTNCPSKECETYGQCYVTIIHELSGERRIYREQACLNKSKQFPPGSSYKCREGHSNKIYKRMREEIFCCRDADFCNRHVTPASGGLAQPQPTQEAPPWLEPGEKGGEGKASTSPASPPSNRLESHH